MLLLRASPGGESPLFQAVRGIWVLLVADDDDAGDGGGCSEVGGTPIGSVWVQYCREVLSPSDQSKGRYCLVSTCCGAVTV